jgi:hypothetical protein
VAPVTPVSFRKTGLAIPCCERDLCRLASYRQVAHKVYIQLGTKQHHWDFGAKKKYLSSQRSTAAKSQVYVTTNGLESEATYLHSRKKEGFPSSAAPSAWRIATRAACSATMCSLAPIK